MIKVFTENDLIRYVYDETSEVENLDIENALLFDSETQEEYSQLVELKSQLSSVEYIPSESSVSNILSKAKKLQKLSSVANK